MMVNIMGDTMTGTKNVPEKFLHCFTRQRSS